MNKELMVFHTSLFILFPLALVLTKRGKKIVIRFLLTVFNFFGLINLGHCSYGTLENLGIDDMCNGKIIWSRKERKA